MILPIQMQLICNRDIWHLSLSTGIGIGITVALCEICQRYFSYFYLFRSQTGGILNRVLKTPGNGPPIPIGLLVTEQKGNFLWEGWLYLRYLT